MFCTDWLLISHCLKPLIRSCSTDEKQWWCQIGNSCIHKLDLRLQGGHLAPKGFIYTVKCKRRVTRVSGELKYQLRYSCWQKESCQELRIPESFPKYFYTQKCLDSYSNSPSTHNIITMLAKLNRYFDNKFMVF